MSQVPAECLRTLPVVLVREIALMDARQHLLWHSPASWSHAAWPCIWVLGNKGCHQGCKAASVDLSQQAT